MLRANEYTNDMMALPAAVSNYSLSCNPANLSNSELFEFPDIVLIQYNLKIFPYWQQLAGTIRWSFPSSM